MTDATGRKEGIAAGHDTRSLNPNVSVIPATKPFVQSSGQLKDRKCLRVSAYCRVSTGDESQQTSFTRQYEFYRELIEETPGWSMAGIYADEAISGTSRKRRKQFNRMMEDAKAGKMDYIITKSISRFARNTVDTLECVRELKQQDLPVGIYFEKENIDTLDAKGELILTILSALAQEESRSISENIRWTFQKNFQNGKPHVNLKRMLGYDLDISGNWVVNEEQAEIVRYIFEQYGLGQTAGNIAAKLNKRGYTTVNGKKWRSDGVLYILNNEKYVGDCAMQKYVSDSFLNHKYRMNEGQAPKYYVTDHHVGIISRETWNQIQGKLQIQKKNQEMKKQSGERKKGIFSNLGCACGGMYIHAVYHGNLKDYTDERSAAAQGLDPAEYKEEFYYTYAIWKCGRKYDGRRKHDGCRKRGRLTVKERKRAEEKCNSPVLNEIAMKQSFMEMLYQMRADYEREGEKADFVQRFKRFLEALSQVETKTESSAVRMELSRAKVKKLESDYERAVMMETTGRESCLDAVRKQIEEEQIFQTFLKKEQDAVTVMKQNLQLFLQCLLNLPDVGWPGREKNRRLFLFEKDIYRVFIQDGIVEGDCIRYRTALGIEMECYGNTRKLADFIGYRKRNANGLIETIVKPYQVSERAVGYRRKEKPC